MQKLDHKSKRFVRYIDRLNTRWLRLSARVAQGALSYAKTGKAERIFCGHTHVAEQRETDGVQYFNSGGWIDRQCTYITIGEKGVQIHEYSGLRTDDRDSLQRALLEEGIQTAVHYAVPAHLQPAYSNLGYGRGSFPNAEAAADQVLSLPIYPELTDAQQGWVVSTLADFLK